MSFDRILGQDRAVALLRRALASGHVGHAYLFAGPDGVGKLMTAREFSKALVCKHPSPEACDTCPACRKVGRGTHPDVFLVQPRGAGRQIRMERVSEEIIPYFRTTPNEAEHKVVLIDDAHRMNVHTANCLLKTLEEPPPPAVLILVTPRPDILLETIRSRCQMVEFGLLPEGLVRRCLENNGISPDDAADLARLANGSPRSAFEIARLPDWRQMRSTIIELAAGLTDSNIVAAATAFSNLVRGIAQSRVDENPDDYAEIDNPRSAVRTESRKVAEMLLDLVELFYWDAAMRKLGFPDERLVHRDLADWIDRETSIATLGIRGILDTIEMAKRLVRQYLDLDAVILDAFSQIAAHRSHRAA